MTNGTLEWSLTSMVLGAGALGTAAFGVVDGLKRWKTYASKGFEEVPATLGPVLMNSLSVAYGPEYHLLLEAQYSDGRSKGDLGRTLRQGVRIGLTVENAGSMADAVGVVDAERLAAVVQKLRQGMELEPEEKGILGRFELAVDARIDAALGLAERAYQGWARVTAYIVAIILSLLAALGLAVESAEGFTETIGKYLIWGLILGVAAVPLAPIAKDVATGIQAAAKALRARA